MPKIRGIKPDYWTDEDIVELSIPARLLFIGLWTYACDNGHLQDKPKQIKLRVLPGDDISATKLLDELASSGRIERINGWITIPNFTRHQKPDKRYFQACDAPGCDRPEGDSQRETRGARTVPPTSAQRVPSVVSLGPHVDGDGDGDGDSDSENSCSPAAPRKAASADKSAESFNDFWKHYPRKVGRGQAVKAWKTATRKVAADELVRAAEAFAAKSRGADPKFIPHASTWLNGERWADVVEPEPPPRRFPPETPTPPNFLTDQEMADWMAEHHPGLRR